MGNIFNRVCRLIGNEKFDRLRRLRIIIFGLGGVGSWTAESLIRSGVGALTIVDADIVAPTNINRQLMATTATVGQSKADTLRQRLLEINPQADITAINRMYCPDTASEFDLSKFDYVVDAIDSLADKALLILNATSTPGVKLLSSMGAALKMDPTQIAVAEFWKVKGCPLAAALRRRFKKIGHMPRRKFQCVYSAELLPNLGEADSSDTAMTYGKSTVNGALCHITAIFGFTLAGLIIKQNCR